MVKKILLVLLIISLILSMSQIANTRELTTVEKGEICFYSGLTLVVYSFVCPIRSEEMKTFINPYTKEEYQGIVHYAHPRWVELGIGLVLHQIGIRLILTDEGLAYKLKF